MPKSVPHVIVIGAGIIGATIACRLSRAGTRVTVLDAGAPGATAQSFGWINASFFLNRDHFMMRDASIAAWHRLEAETGPLPIQWQGCLWWEEQGAAFDTMAAQLADLGYRAEHVGPDRFADLAPAIADRPAQALLLPDEGAADTPELARHLLAIAAQAGAQVYCGVTVQGLTETGGRITAVRTAQGLLDADHVVIAAGIGTPALIAPFGIDLQMLRRPGVTITTAPVAPCLGPVMVSPEQEFRQLPDGRILAPTSANHKGDDTSEIIEPLAGLAARTLARLRAHLPGHDLRIERTGLALRPVPGDGLPVIGPAGPAGPEGLYLAVMHSGATLAAIVGELAMRELTGQGDQAMLTPYRFSGSRF